MWLTQLLGNHFFGCHRSFSSSVDAVMLVFFVFLDHFLPGHDVFHGWFVLVLLGFVLSAVRSD